jgi:site-specific DNA recombinase
VGLLNNANASARLADLEAQVRAGEARLAAIAGEIAALGRRQIDSGDVANALRQFTGITQALTPAERERLVHLLVERVVYDGAKSSVSITFRSTGIKTLSQETP